MQQKLRSRIYEQRNYLLEVFYGLLFLHVSLQKLYVA